LAGLILALLLAGAATGDPLPRLEAKRAHALERLDSMLLAPDGAPSPAWRARLFHWARRLDHNTDPRVLAAWELLAAHGGPGDRANLLLFQRRHRLPLSFDAAAATEADPVLEHALFLWGEGRLAETDAALAAAAAAFPEDARLSTNLEWLRGAPAGPFDLEADARATALAVLAARARAGRG
jgi:hypothetical protein